MRPGGIQNDLVLFHAHFAWGIGLFYNGEWSEDILLDHFYNMVEVGDDCINDHGLVVEELGELSKVAESFILGILMKLEGLPSP